MSFALGVAISCLWTPGCALPGVDWRHTGQPGQQSNVVAADDTIVGQINDLKKVAASADLMRARDRAAAAKRLRKKLQNGSTPLPVRVQIVKTLSNLQTREAVAGLEAALRDSDAELRAEACRGLGQDDSGQALATLAEVVRSDPSTDVRQTAARVLGKYQTPPAVRALAAALDDSDPAVQYVAMKSLKRSTGTDLGWDVRRWKQATKNPELILADRGASRR